MENRFRLLYVQTGIKHPGTEWKYINKHTYDTFLKMPLELFSENSLAKSFPLPYFVKIRMGFSCVSLPSLWKKSFNEYNVAEGNSLILPNYMWSI